MTKLSDAELERGVVTASAGNHAQGVALAAKKLGTRATIFMPRSTPRMKQMAVARIGGEVVDVRLEGDGLMTPRRRPRRLRLKTAERLFTLMTICR